MCVWGGEGQGEKGAGHLLSEYRADPPPPSIRRAEAACAANVLGWNLFPLLVFVVNHRVEDSRLYKTLKLGYDF